MKAKLISLITLLGFIIGGMSYWFQPYNQMQLIGNYMMIIRCTGVFFGALILMFFIKKEPFQISLFLAFGIMLAYFARLIYDITFWDSTSHNLAGIEIIIVAFITIPFVFAGSFFASIFILLAKHKFKQAFVTIITLLLVVLMMSIPILLIRQKSNFNKKIEDKTLDTTQVVQLYKKAIKKGDVEAISIIAVHPNLPDSIQKNLSNSEFIDVRKSIAFDTDSEEIIRKLSVDKEWEVRLAVTINNLTPIEILNNLQSDTNEDVRNFANSAIQNRK